MDVVQPDATDELPELITEGSCAAGILPTYERALHLEAALRAELERLVPAVQAHADTLNRGTPQWYLEQRCVDRGRAALAGDRGAGLRSAALHVTALARATQFLAQYELEVTG